MRLAGIWIKRAKRGPMDPVGVARLVAGRGIAGNANQGGRRQVTLLSQEHWDTLTGHLTPADPLDTLNPIVRRANLLLTGIDLRESRGRILRIGEGRIRILGETRPCERMDEARQGLGDALSPPWGGGAFGEVIADATITVGDVAEWV